MKLLALIKGFWGDIYDNKFVIGQLVKRDYKNRYLGSFLGFVWTIIQPLVMLLVLWLVFEKGFKSGPIVLADGRVIPFIAWFALGIVAWNFFAETLSAITSVFQEYSYLIKKINFKVAVLPIVKILSSLITHVIFLIIAIVIISLSGVEFSWYWFQMFYYLASVTILLLGLGWILSSIQVFFRDMSQIVSVFLSIGFWVTPVCWNLNILAPDFAFYFKLNPMFYIVEGYRKSFLFHEAFWKNTDLMIYFWGVTFIVLIIGVMIFKRLRSHFSDVL